MARTYQPKYLPDGTPNPKHYARKTPGYSKERRAEYDRNREVPRNGKRSYRCETAPFISLDGEGGEYNGKHVYQLLMSDSGASIYKEAGLSTIECFDFLLREYEKRPKGIFTIFGGSYDANMFLADLPPETLQRIVEADGKYYVWIGDYGIRYMARKYFALRHILMRDSNRGLVIWDVQDFFQSSFIQAVKAWLPDWAKEKLELIVKGKSLRSTFTGSEIDFIKSYCAAELEALTEIMTRFRATLSNMGIKLSRWDGAGAVAMGMYKINSVKDYYDELPPAVETAAQHAYFGGRIEIGKVGQHIGTIHHYDINSAYPAIQRNLPALAGGLWLRIKPGGDDIRFSYIDAGGNRFVVYKSGGARPVEEKLNDDYHARILRGRAQPLSVYLVRWSNLTNTRFCPFPYRSEAQRKVLFPEAGLNWVWLPELEAALKVKYDKAEHWQIEILDGHEFYPAIDHKPFGWIDPYYNERQKIVKESKRTGIPNGREKVIKLGLNSLYGKTAQRVGYDATTGRKPPYHNLAYAGYITAATRAALWSAAMQADDKIICLATDGIYSQVPLTLDCPEEKQLGKWEYQTHDGMALIQAGFYFIFDGDKIKSFSRGFDKMREEPEMRETLAKILHAWKCYSLEVFLPCTRFITLKTALINSEWFTRWRCWYQMIQPDGTPGRRLAVLPHGTKRTLDDKRSRADKQMLQTKPTANMTPDVLSAPHSLPWDDDGEENGQDLDFEQSLTER